MFFIISRIISSFTDPFFVAIALFIAAVIIRNAKYKKRFAITSVLIITVFGNVWFGDFCFSVWEKNDQTQPAIATHRFGVVLGGFATYKSEKNGQVYFEESSDRLLTAIQLYKQGKIQKLVLSGGEARIISVDQREADIAAEYLFSIGIPKEDVIIENNSKNTHENAENTAKLLLPQLKKNESILLVTSAYHIPRATSSFEKEGFIVTPFKTDYYTKDENDLSNLFTIKLAALKQWRVLIHEILGFATYKILGFA